MCLRGVVLFAVAVGCSEPSSPAEEAAGRTEQTAITPGERGTQPDGDDPLAGLDDPSTFDDGAGASGPPADVPAGGCAFYTGEPTRLWARGGLAEVVDAGDDGFVVAGYARKEEGEELFAVRVEPGSAPRPLYRADLERPLRTPRVAPPGLGRLADGSFGIAATDLGARVLFARVHPAGRQSALRSLDTGTDQRFSPAVRSSGGGALVAFTDGSNERSRVRVVVTNAVGERTAVYDVTPAAGSAQAPVFIADRLAFLDPREGTSQLMAVRASSARPITDAEVLVPIANLFDPAGLALAEASEGFAVVYTAVGRGAKTAVGFVRTDDPAQPPKALVPSSGYGPLHVDATSSDTVIVYAASRSTAEARDTPRELAVFAAPRSAPDRWGEPLVLAAPAFAPRVARHGEDYAVVYGTDNAVFARFFRCREP
ncbi:MAG: hypothetical protein AAF411_08720 [Myxococcota bacterium]